jgi:hypothetical protein
MQSVVLLNAIMLGVVILSVLAPSQTLPSSFKRGIPVVQFYNTTKSCPLSLNIGIRFNLMTP